MRSNRFPGKRFWDRKDQWGPISQERGRINCTTRLGLRTSAWEDGAVPGSDQCRLQGRKARALAAEVPVRHMILEPDDEKHS